jgi:2-keto-4-pentenoate hydratase/2-oxohepta-3-ene-1,7-dioic acid hydratase in catechol pathway
MKIFGVGMNYRQHTVELGHLAPPPQGADEKTGQPVIFLKADSALLKDGKPFFVPDWAERFDYEAELVVRICRLGKGIPERFAHRYWDAVTVGIDFTARDMQQRARSEGLPWAICKGFDGSAAIGRWISKQQLAATSAQQDDRLLEPRSLSFHLDINGHTVQQGCAADMVYSIDQLISYLSQFFTLRTGDLLFTGTPAGVGPVHIGDHLQGYLENGNVNVNVNLNANLNASEPVLDFYCR